MSRVKLFINNRDSGVLLLAEQLRTAKIDYAAIPTSGPTVIWLDGRASYGITAVGYAVRWLVEHARDWNKKGDT